MTLNEFKAWLEGYESSFTGLGPTADQYNQIKEKLKKVTTGPTYNPDFNKLRPLGQVINPPNPAPIWYESTGAPAHF